MKRILKILIWLLLPWGIHAQSVTYVEYFIDSDPGRGQATAVGFPAGANRTVSFNVPLDNVSYGMHTLYVRAKDQSRHWSFVEYRPFLKESVDLTDIPDVAYLEYFIDTDPGRGAANPISLASGDSVYVTANIDLTGVSTGVHLIYIRARDEFGHWSPVSWRPFLKESLDLFNPSNVQSIHYTFFQGSWQSSVYTVNNFTPGTDLTLNFMADLSALQVNQSYEMYIFARDAEGRESFLEQRTVTVSPPQFPALSLYPNPVNFGMLPVASHADTTLTFTNTGTADLMIHDVRLVTTDTTAFDLLSTGQADTLAAGQDKTERVRFFPNRTGLHSAFLIITSNAPSNPDTIQISGTGSAPEMVIFPDSLHFGDVQAGETKLDSIKIKNSGTAALAVDSLQLSGVNFQQFSTDTSGFNLNPGDSLFRKITFAPDAAQIFSATLTIFSEGDSQRVALQGRGIDAELRVKPLALDFGDVRAGETKRDSIKIKNSGTAALAVDSLQFSGANFQQFSTDTSGFNLNPGDSLFQKITFAPNVAQIFTATLTIFSEGDSQRVALQGRGIDAELRVKPLALDFGDVHAGETKRDSIKIKNFGTATLAVDSLQLSGANFQQFSTDTSGFNLNPGDSLFRKITFAPNVAQIFSATLTIFSEGDSQRVALQGRGIDAELRVKPLALDFGAVRAGEIKQDSIKIRNSGSAALAVDSLQFSGAIFNQFSTDTSGFNLNPGDSLFRKITFAPDAAQIFSATLTIFSEGDSQRVALQGRGIDAELRVKPLALDFGAVRAGEIKQDSIKIRNSGSAALAVDSLQFSGAIFNQFSTDTSGFNLNPGDSLFRKITFAPDAAQIFSATLTIFSEGDSQRVALQGRGIDAELRVKPLALDFGDVRAGETKRDSIKIKNSGTAALAVDSLQFAGANFQQFSTDTGGFNLNPGDSLFRKITFAPDAAQIFSATLTIFSEGDSQRVALQGRGIDAELRVNPLALDFGDVRAGETKRDSIKIKNSGTAALAVDSLQFSGVNFRQFSTDTSGFNLNPGDSLFRKITFAPDGTGNFTATLAVVRPEFTQNIQLSGQGIRVALTVTPDTLNLGQILISATKIDSFKFQNIGTESVLIDSLRIAPVAGITFSVGSPVFTLTAGSNRFIRIECKPDSLTTFRTFLSYKFDGKTVRIPVSGTGTAPALTWSARNLDFGTIPVGADSSLLIHLSNPEKSTVFLDSLAITGTNATEFILPVRFAAVPLTPGQVLNIPVRFRPLTGGAKNARLNCVDSQAGILDTLRLTGTGYLPTVTVAHDSNASVGKPLDFQINPPENFHHTVKRLYYRRVGESAWHFIELAQQGTQFTGSIPPDSISSQGIEYFISLTDGTNEITYPAENAREQPAAVRVRVATLSAPVLLPKLAYKMISVPVKLSAPAIDAVLGDDLGTHNKQLWRLLRWNEDSIPDYLEYPALPDSFHPGKAFWIISRSEKQFDIENGQSTPFTGAYPILLQPGWNQIGNPFAFPVAWEDVEVPANVTAPVYFNGIEYSDYNVTRLQPWEGYFVKNLNTGIVKLQIPPKEAAATSRPKPTLTQFFADSGFVLQLSVKMLNTRLVDSQNFVGFVAGATDTQDPLDLAEAPPIGEQVRVSIIEAGEKWAGNFKNPNQAGHTWTLELSTNLGPGIVQLERQSFGRLPEGFEIFLLDEDYRCSLPAEQEMLQIHMESAQQVRHFRLIIGTADFAATNSDGIPLLPITFLLAQNYPNPFNPTTTIQYQLPQRGQVQLVILNVLGQSIQELVNEIQDTGSHTISWNGQNAAGQPVASGVYFCRLHTVNGAAVRKLILMR